MVYVSCGGYVRPYKNMKEVLETFKEYTYWCEGSERERYMIIVMQALDNLDKNEVCVSDGMRVVGVDFDIMSLTTEQLATIRKGFHLTPEELVKFATKYEERRDK